MKIRKLFIINFLSNIFIRRIGFGKQMMDQKQECIYDDDFSILKKMDNSIGIYSYRGKKFDAIHLFKMVEYSYGRMRIFHTSDSRVYAAHQLKTKA